MGRLLLALLLVTAACATTPYAPVRDPAWQAMGWRPGWTLAIGDDRIVLRTAERGDRAWPRVLPRTVDGWRTWESGTGADRIRIAAHRTLCQSPDQPGSRYVYNYENQVAVSVGEQNSEEYRGCGGRIVERIEVR
jgi:uncharacterized membrane protein